MSTLRPRRFVVAALAWAVLLGGCRPVEPAPGPDGLAARLLAVRDDPARRLRLVWQGSPYAEGGQPDSWLQRRFEERFNVALQVDFISIFSYDRVLRFKLIGGNIPDVFWVRDSKEAKNFVDQGFALELPLAVVAHHAPDYLRQVQKHAPDAWLLAAHRGRNWGLPTFNTSSAVLPFNGIWNETWLRRVGLERVPETLAEMEEALRRFRHGDPDGDGRLDTFGYCPWKPGATGGTMDRSFEDIFGAFGIAQNAWLLRAGRVEWGGVRPEAREALALLRRWYADGLIHPDYMTLPVGNLEVRSQLFKGNVGYIMGFNLGGWAAFDAKFPTSIQALIKSSQPDAHVVPGWFPAGPRGERGVRAWSGTIGGIVMFGPQLAREPEKLVRVLRAFNEAARDPAVYLELRLGQEGLHWRFDPEYGIRKLPPYDTRHAGSRELMGEGILNDIQTNFGYFIPFAADREVTEKLTTEAARRFRDRYQRPEWGIRDVLCMADTLPSSGKYQPGLVELQAIAFTEIITGKRPLEHFDRFVAEWHRQGGTTLTEEANELYRRKGELQQTIARLLAERSAP